MRRTSPRSRFAHGLREFVVVGCGLMSACVLPKFEISGAELSWFVVESNLVDDDGARRIRSCDGALVTNVDFWIVDDDDDDREKLFTWSCDEGYRTPAEFFTGASDVFVELAPGNYRMSVTSVDDPKLRGAEGEPVSVSQDTSVVAIGSDNATLLQWELDPLPVDWSIELSGTGSCEKVQARLVHPDPVAVLPAEEATEGLSALYRENLETDGGLGLGGDASDCDALTEGTHLTVGVDRGRYALEVSVDGSSWCPIDVELDGRQQALALDLGELPC